MALFYAAHVYGGRVEVFRDAVRQQATAIVAVHNHPSGDPTPSSADMAFTVEIVTAILVTSERPEEATRLYGAADALRGVISLPMDVLVF